ncbi:sensor histidine kinase, partial [Chloroflexota bacterium]
MRRFSHDLRPSVLDDLGLLPALELLADDLETNGISTVFQVVGVARRLPPEVEVMLFRIAQEAVRNIWRHSEASTAELLIEFTDGLLRISIRDNGKGFKSPHRPGDLASLGKLGLVGMHERAKVLGGDLVLTSESGSGTQIVVEVRV